MEFQTDLPALPRISPSCVRVTNSMQQHQKVKLWFKCPGTLLLLCNWCLFLDCASRPAHFIRRFPSFDYVDSPFPDGLAAFCFPQPGKSNIGTPVFHSAVMTEGDGNKLFCSCLTLWAPDENGGTDGEVRRVVLVLLSHWPFWSTMQQALLLLHMYASVDETKGMNSRYPSLGTNFIEAAVQFLVEEVPVPEPGCASSFTFVTGR